MAKIKMTNHNLALSVARENSQVAEALNYRKDAFGNETIDDKNLSLFEANPIIANEFINTMSNQVVSMYAYDIFREFDLPFNFALKTMSRLGDAEDYVTAELSSVSTYNPETTDPFGASKPTIVNNFIKTMDKLQVGVRINEELWAGAFITEGGLANIVGIILKNLRDSVELYVYDKLREYVTDTTAFSKYEVVEKIEGVGETESARKCYEQIMALVNKMSLPSASYNTLGKKTITPKGRFVLLLNADYQASFDINVLASLFHSSNIELSKYFKEVRVIEFPEVSGGTQHQIGFVCDDEALVWGYRTNRYGSIYNPRTMDVNTWGNALIKYGAISTRNAVRLLDETPVGA